MMLGTFYAITRHGTRSHVGYLDLLEVPKPEQNYCLDNVSWTVVKVQEHRDERGIVQGFDVQVK